MYSYITDCTSYYNYGKINQKICSYCFEYNYSNFDYNFLVDFIERNYYEHRVYLFIAKNHYFPLSFKVKHFGLWKNIKKTEKINVTYYEEKSDEIKEHLCIYGLAEIPYEQLNKAIELLCKNSFSSFIVLSKEDSFNKFKYADFLKQKVSGYEILFSNLINTYVQDNVVITCINGNNGITVNIFNQMK